MLVFNISMNLSDNLVGKSGPGFTYVNEIETIVEFIAEVILDKKDYIPENQIPGGTLGFEEEEKHLYEESGISANRIYIPDLLYKKNFKNRLRFTDHIAEVPTPPPNILYF